MCLILTSSFDLYIILSHCRLHGLIKKFHITVLTGHPDKTLNKHHTVTDRIPKLHHTVTDRIPRQHHTVTDRIPKQHHTVTDRIPRQHHTVTDRIPKQHHTVTDSKWVSATTDVVSGILLC